VALLLERIFSLLLGSFVGQGRDFQGRFLKGRFREFKTKGGKFFKEEKRGL